MGETDGSPPAPSPPPPLLVVVSGPSGVGKDALLTRIHERGERFAPPVTTTTTRPARPGEVDGRDYLFVSREQFQSSLDSGEFVEHAEVYGNRYGVSRTELRKALATGRDVIMRVDVQGAATLREVVPEALLLFLTPDDSAQLAVRLRARGHEDEDALRRRIATAERELAQREHFDHVVVNVEGDLDGTVDRVLTIVAAERAREGRRVVRV